MSLTGQPEGWCGHPTRRNLKQKAVDLAKVGTAFCLLTCYFDNINDYYTECKQYHDDLVIAHKAPPPYGPDLVQRVLRLPG